MSSKMFKRRPPLRSKKFEETSVRNSKRSEEKYQPSSTLSHGYNKHETIEDRHRHSPSNIDRHLASKSTENTRSRPSYNETRYDDRGTSERFVSYNPKASSNDDECVASLWQKIDYLSSQVEFLTQENDKLRWSENGTRNNIHHNPNAKVFINFKNKDLEEKFVPVLEELVSDLIQGHITVDELRQFQSSKKNSLDDIEDWKNLPEESLFALDNSTVEPDDNPRVPVYETSFGEILENEDVTVQSKSPAKKKAPKVCFHCSEDHFKKDCPSLNRKKAYFKFKIQRTTSIPKRYHDLQGENAPKAKPGLLSDELRNALGLRQNQVPEYIYRMRLYDYPPGWLEEAIVENSGINLYDTDGFAQKNENGESSQVDMNSTRVQYDPEKFIDYPGFNVPLSPDIVDECYEYGFPQLQPHQLRSVIEQNMPKLADVRPNRKRKLGLSGDNQPSMKCERYDEDMDLDEDLGETLIEFTPPLPQEAPPPLPPPEDVPEPPEDDIKIVASHDSDSGTNTPMSDSIMEALAPVVERFKLNHNDLTGASTSSPSLKELEEIKKRLVMELDIESECSSPGIQDNSNPNVSDAEDSNPTSRGSYACQDNNNDLSSFSDCSFSSSPAEGGQSSRKMDRSASTCSMSKQMTLGTPSLSRHSSFNRLPDYDNFSKNVTTHLNFENLPNSTGTYEKMKKVIKKVKEKFNSFIP